MKLTFPILVLVMLLSVSFTDKPVPLQNTDFTASTDEAEQDWVDSVFNAMTPAERLGQLFIIRAHSDKGPEHVAAVKKQIAMHKVGGLCFFQGTPDEQIRLTNDYQLLSNVPLFVSIDGEWGLGMRMKESTISFPKQLTLGAIQDNRLIYEMGEEIARQMKRVGVHINFAPVADVNNNPANPVINTRSFGEDRYNVAVKSYMYMKGMQDHNVMACAKHFPGHGDTDVDSHLDLPVIRHSMQRLDSIELYPFRVLAEKGIGSMMVAHLNVPALDNRQNRPTTLSEQTITGVLKKKIGFEGLIMTDALEMKGVTKYFQPGVVEAEALVAGNDMLLLPESIEAAIREINNYISSGKLTQASVDERVKKVLRAKYRMGLTKFERLSEQNVRAELNTNAALAIKQKLYENALTLVRNDGNVLPIQDLNAVKLVSISLGATAKTPFQKRLGSYKQMQHLFTDNNISEADQRQLLEQVKGSDLVIIGLHDLSSYASRNFGLTQSELAFIKTLQQQYKVVVVNFGSPYALKYFDDVEVLVNAYEEDALAQDAAAQALFGAVAFRGRLPITASPKATFNTGIQTQSLNRMGYGLPESVNLNSDILRRIDFLMADAIRQEATPGGVVLVAKDGKIVFHEAYGHHTYDEREPVQKDDIYDLASITKIAASTISVMKLQEEGKISITQPLSNYVPELQFGNKATLTLQDIMAHRAGLYPWIPFYEQTISKGANPQPLPKYYSSRRSDEYPSAVTEQLYLRQDFQDTIWQQLIDSEVSADKGYVYSDIGYYFIGRMIEEQTSMPIQDYVQQTFYQPLGLQTATYNPLEKFPKSRIVPTEEDAYWRRQRIHGYVHDMGAAMLDGVSGHAGLFADAEDLAVIMQLLLNGGHYGGKQYLKSETINEFTTRHPKETRRGIGFDMKQLDDKKAMNMSPLASAKTFGHPGFTGTFTFADPEHNIVYVFLSNRTYPSMDNKKLYQLETREKIQSVIYQAIQEKEDLVTKQ